MLDILLSKFKLKHFLGSLALLASLIWLAVFFIPSQKLKIVFCDVGQGDAILIEKGENQILIDGGPNNKVLDCLANNMPFWDRTIEIVALTHPQADHLDGLNYIFERYSVKYFLSGPEGNSSAGFAALMSNVKSQMSNKKLKIINPYLGEEIKLAGIELETIWPEKNWVAAHLEAENVPSLTSESSFPPPTSHFILGASTTQDLNNFSLAFLLKYGSVKALFPGDADAGIQDQILLNNHTLSTIDILKVPHHGAKTSLRDDFLEIIKTKEAIISVGKNSYGHPDSELIKKLENMGIKVRRTDLEGEIKYEIE